MCEPGYEILTPLSKLAPDLLLFSWAKTPSNKDKIETSAFIRQSKKLWYILSLLMSVKKMP